jgi:hypothetical protein
MLLGAALMALFSVPGRVLAHQESVPPVRAPVGTTTAEELVVRVPPTVERALAAERRRARAKRRARLDTLRAARRPAPRPAPAYTPAVFVRAPLPQPEPAASPPPRAPKPARKPQRKRKPAPLPAADSENRPRGTTAAAAARRSGAAHE